MVKGTYISIALANLHNTETGSRNGNDNSQTPEALIEVDRKHLQTNRKQRFSKHSLNVKISYAVPIA